jgi:UDP-glucose 4-epimerase
MKALVTGGAGFIGSNLVAHLLDRGANVVVIDNFSTGQAEFLLPLRGNVSLRVVEGDLLDKNALAGATADRDVVFHFAANADLRFGLDAPDRDLNQNILATHNVLEAMRAEGIKKIVFSSTAAVTGESNIIPTPEDPPMPVQTSLYGASKAAAEGFISAYAVGYGMTALIFRFVSIMGPHYTHGHVFDFVKALRADSTRLRVLGDGQQRKSYLHVSDCVSAILHALDSGMAEKNEFRTEIFNLGNNGYCVVDQSIGWITDEMGLKPILEHTGGKRGWIGDNPFLVLDPGKIRALGWRPKYSVEDCIRETVRWIQANPWVMERRP